MKLVILLILAILSYSLCSERVGSAKGYIAKSRFATSDITLQAIINADLNDNFVRKRRTKNIMQSKKPLM